MRVSLKELTDFDAVFNGQKSVALAGVDEAGRGPLAGPVVVAAVVVRDAGFEVRIDDSKKLSPRARRKAYHEIRRRCWVACAMRDSSKIDSINILQATLEAMREAVRNLPVKPDRVIVDGPQNLGPECPSLAVVGGDGRSLAIACASIVAKTVRDRLMMRYDCRFPLYGFAAHKGYGTAEHIEKIRRHGPCRIHRRSFEPVASLAVLEAEADARSIFNRGR